jgi:hypothetical protein
MAHTRFIDEPLTWLGVQPDMTQRVERQISGGNEPPVSNPDLEKLGSELRFFAIAVAALKCKP